ncbi:MAG: hypothetical protein CSA22_06095 [Deltaproteobacteria bacterium]|nr:MAG: hypothetical protein CSA22_06095 [Deltaproteobacteria bacterium]
MYLARLRQQGKCRYFLRESYLTPEMTWYYRDLMDLGTSPEAYIEYYGGNSFSVSQKLLDSLEEMGCDIDGEGLETLLWDFVDPEVRHCVEHFRTRSMKQKSRSKEDTLSPAAEFHPFDCRRIYYLKYGNKNTAAFHRISPRPFQWLKEKSRDEIEHRFMAEEAVIRPTELKAYIFACLGLDRHFMSPFYQTYPAAIPQEEADAAFLNDICELNQDASFWLGMPAKAALSPYLIRYVIMFFDHMYPRPRFAEHMFNAFMNRHRHHHRPPPRQQMPVHDALALLGLEAVDPSTLTRRQLSRVFRKKAQEFHPDAGGNHEAFIRLAAAYQDLKAQLFSA